MSSVIDLIRGEPDEPVKTIDIPEQTVTAKAPGKSAFDFLSLLPTGLDAGFELLGDWINRSWQERMMNKQRDWQLEDWRRTTEYNSPAAVISRMRSAGLNPDLLTGAGTGSQSAVMPERGSTPGGASVGGLNVQSVSDAVNRRATSKMLDAEVSYIRSQARLNNANAEEQELDNSIRSEHVDDYTSGKVADMRSKVYSSDAAFSMATFKKLESFAAGYVPEKDSPDYSLYNDVYSRSTAPGVTHFGLLANAIIDYKRKHQDWELSDYEIKRISNIFEKSKEYDTKQLQSLIDDIERDQSWRKYESEHTWIPVLLHYLKELVSVGGGVGKVVSSFR